MIAWSLASLLTVMLLATGASGVFVGNLLNTINGHSYAISPPMPLSGEAEVMFHLLDKSAIPIGPRGDSQIESHTNKVDGAALAVFMAFLVGGVTSVLGAVYGGKGNQND